MSIIKEVYGKTSKGEEANIYTLSNKNGMKAKITNYGAIVQSLFVPDRNGVCEDVVLGYDNLESYFTNPGYFGVIAGRYANRIANASFKLNDKEYNLAKNDGNNHLHGGIKGFNKVLWKAEIIEENGEESLSLSYKSVDMEEGYPGNLNVKVIYTVTEDNELKIEYKGISDKDTIVNLTNHSYFNLNGYGSGDVLNHDLMINADNFTVIDKEAIPTGELRKVFGTPFDFTKLKKIGKNIDDSYEQVKSSSGYDHNFVINDEGEKLKKTAYAIGDKSGITMEVYTTKPGVQLYTANFLDGSEIGKNSTPCNERNGFCLETQHYPDSINQNNFPSPIIKKGEEYNYLTIYKFSNK
ncbi:MAG: aldose epimerase family protein [Clostridiaceae bacterium]